MKLFVHWLSLHHVRLLRKQTKLWWNFVVGSKQIFNYVVFSVLFWRFALNRFEKEDQSNFEKFEDLEILWFILIQLNIVA
jgi:hypothetical protein